MLEVAYDYVDVAGIKYRRDAVLDFMEAIDNGLPGGVRLEPEPSNIYDPNAIKIIGWWTDQQRHVGYVPAVLSELIAYKRLSSLAAELAHYDLLEGTNERVLQIRILTA